MKLLSHLNERWTVALDTPSPLSLLARVKVGILPVPIMARVVALKFARPLTGSRAAGKR